MKCRGKFKFKGLRKKNGGEFTNEAGQTIQYPATYQLVVDESTDDGIYERTFKLPIESELVEPLLITKPYTDLEIEFDVVFYSSSVKLTPIALVK